MSEGISISVLIACIGMALGSCSKGTTLYHTAAQEGKRVFVMQQMDLVKHSHQGDYYVGSALASSVSPDTAEWYARTFAMGELARSIQVTLRERLELSQQSVAAGGAAVTTVKLLRSVLDAASIHASRNIVTVFSERWMEQDGLVCGVGTVLAIKKDLYHRSLESLFQRQQVDSTVQEILKLLRE